MKKILKYGTGAKIPADAIYLCTKVEQDVSIVKNTHLGLEDHEYRNQYVWHYFLVTV